MAKQPATTETTNDLIGELDALNLQDLRALWRNQWGGVPTLRSPDLLRMMVGWRLQARTHGGLDEEVRRKVRKKVTIEAEGLDLGTGSTIARQWQGKTYEIQIEEDGFRWDGTLYPSLSAVATAITGTRWNGPRFFGMREAKK